MPVGHMRSGKVFWKEDNTDINIGGGGKGMWNWKVFALSKEEQWMRVDGWDENLIIVKRDGLIVYKVDISICLKKLRPKIRDHIKEENKITCRNEN